MKNVAARSGTRTSAAPAGAAVALVLSALVYAVSETVTAHAWSTPAYLFRFFKEFDIVKITISGASGLIGGKLAARLRERGDEETVLSQSVRTSPSTWQWDPLRWPRSPAGTPWCTSRASPSVNA
jgi:hypothetical protein